MAFTIQFLAQYLGRPTSTLLVTPLLRDWPHERSVEGDLDPVLIDYVFPEHGIDVQSDPHDHVATIFLYFDASRRCSQDLAEISADATRDQVRATFGQPSKSGTGLCDPMIGQFRSLGPLLT